MYKDIRALTAGSELRSKAGRMSCLAIPGLTGIRARTSAEASFSGRHPEYHYILHSPHTGFLRSHSRSAQVATRYVELVGQYLTKQGM